MSLFSALSVPARLSRYGVMLVGAATLAFTASYWHSRVLAAEPVRLAKDADGVLRLMTRAELLRLRVAEAEEAAAAAPDDAEAQQSLAMWRAALVAEAQRQRHGRGEGGEVTADNVDAHVERLRQPQSLAETVKAGIRLKLDLPADPTADPPAGSRGASGPASESGSGGPSGQAAGTDDDVNM